MQYNGQRHQRQRQRKNLRQKVKGGQCAAEKQDVNKLMLQCLGPLVQHSSFSSSLPPDPNKESCSQPAQTLTLIFKLLAPRIFKRSGSSADVKIVQGVWPNQEPLSLPTRFFFSFLAISSFFGVVFCFLYPRTFFCF